MTLEEQRASERRPDTNRRSMSECLERGRRTGNAGVAGCDLEALSTTSGSLRQGDEVYLGAVKSPAVDAFPSLELHTRTRAHVHVRFNRDFSTICSKKTTWRYLKVIIHGCFHIGTYIKPEHLPQTKSRADVDRGLI